MFDELLQGAIYGLYISGFALIIFGVIIIIYLLAKMDLFFTIVNEGQAKAIKKFGKFHKCVMSYEGHAFRKELKKESDFANEDDFVVDGDDWDVIKCKKGRGPSNFGGLRWIGWIPFAYSVHTFRFNWTSLEQTKDKDGKMEERLVPTEKEDATHVLVQDDVYVSEMTEVETHGMIPMDITLLLTIAVVNPRKALFVIQHWLEATHNQIRPRIREYIGKQEYEDLIKEKKASALEIKKALESTTDAEVNALERLQDEYGVHVKDVQIHRISPSKTATANVDFVKLATSKFAAEKEGEAIEALAKSKANATRTESEAIEEKGETGKLFVTLEALKKVDKLTLISEGNKVLKTLQLNDNE